MKRFLLALFILNIFFAGFSPVFAQTDGTGILETAINNSGEFGGVLGGVGNVLDAGLSIPGEISREAEEFNLKLQYFNRPFKEKDLTFDEWLDLYGYTTFGAGPIPDGKFALPAPEEFGEVGANTDLRKFILNVINWVLSFLGLVCIAMVIYAGYLCIITGGEDGSEKCKKILIYVAVGVFIILVSYALVNTLIRSTTEGGDNFAGIQTSLSSTLIEGYIEVDSTPLMDYGSGFIVPDAVPISFTAGSASNGNPTGLRWSFGDGTIVNTENAITSRSFFNQGIHNVVAIGYFEDTDGVLHDFVAKTRVLVGSSVAAHFVMSPQLPKLNQSVSFNGANSQAIVGIIDEYEWTCDSLVSGMCSSFAPGNDDQFDYTFTEEGEVTISLIVRTNVGDESEVFEKTFNVIQPVTSQIQAKFNVSTSNPAKNGQVQFMGLILPSGLIADDYIWTCQSMGSTSANICTEFNNDSANNSNFYTTFSETGSLKITLSVEKNGEISDEFEKVLNVFDPALGMMTLGSGLNFDVPQAIWIDDSADFIAQNNSNTLYDSYKWTFVEGIQSGNTVTNTFEDGGENIIKLEGLDASATVLDSIEKSVLVAEQGMPIPVLSVNGNSIFPNNIIEIELGDTISFVKNSFDASGNQGASANVTHSWLVNGSIVNESSLSGLSSNVGIYNIKMNAISTIDSNKRTSLSFKIKVSKEAPEINLSVNNSSLGNGFFNMEATVTTADTIPKLYKFEVLEAGKIVSTQVINSSDNTIDAVVDVSNKIGNNNYLFQVTMVDEDGITAKKSLNKNVIIDESSSLNNLPSVEIFTTPATTGLTSTMFQFYTQADDEDNDHLSYKWEFPNGKKSFGKNISHRFYSDGDNTVKVTVSDGIDEVSETVVISVEEDLNQSLNNTAPILLSSGISPGNTGDTESLFKFYSSANDKEGDELDYSWDMGDGNTLNLKNISYKYQFPGKYIVKLTVSDGDKTIRKAIPVTVVAKGEKIPPSGMPDYELENDVTTSSSLSQTSISINSNLSAENIDELSDQINSYIKDKNLELASETDPKEREKLQKIIDLMDCINLLIVEYNSTEDINIKKKLISDINKKRLQLEILDASLNFNFIGLEGTTNTKFFFYSKMPKSERPILIKWDTGDGRSFIGQNVSWKYSKNGNYVVQMEVSDGVSTATDNINIKVK